MITAYILVNKVPSKRHPGRKKERVSLIATPPKFRAEKDRDYEAYPVKVSNKTARKLGEMAGR